ncbi:MAG: uracil-DNA glycosylase family protein [Sinimarinibacterium flocculans]|uniref:uracil-DNA glycosylase family protein n=1 Tax=Sinimarinibacterium flocculans TaxID=985250 RepID=UPI003C63B970
MSRTRGDALSKLLGEVRACRLCEAVLPMAPRPLLQLDRSARILIAGQAPGRRTQEAGVPFADVSGDRLRDWLGVDRDTFYDARRIAILPMGFCFPGSGKGGDLPPRPECAATWRTRLLAQLPRLQLTLVIGQYAAAWHLPQASGLRLTDLAADWRRYWPRLLPMPHPSPRNQRWLRDNPWFAAEVLPALRERVKALTA